MVEERDVSRVSYENEVSSGSRVYLIGGIVVGVLIVVVLIFLVMSFVGDGGGVGERGGDYSGCENPSDKFIVADCKIQEAVDLKDSGLCDEDFDDVRFTYMFAGKAEKDILNARDYCFVKMSLAGDISYCDSLGDENIKELCDVEFELGGGE